MKILNGSDLAGYIKERQAHEVRELRQSYRLFPKLAIIVTVDNPVIEIYMRLKKRYGADILVDVEIFRENITNLPELIETLNNDPSIHGIIIQLPLSDISQTDYIINLVSPSKDVDGLSNMTKFDPATPMAIMWLLAGYNIELKNQKILLIGRGKLVGKPLEKIMIASNLNVQVADHLTKDLKKLSIDSDIIITATGTPSILKSDMIKKGGVVIDAGVASEEGKIKGDVDPEIYERQDLIITPQKGGVGPLTVCALFENVINAARQSIRQ